MSAQNISNLQEFKKGLLQIKDGIDKLLASLEASSSIIPPISNPPKPFVNQAQPRPQPPIINQTKPFVNQAQAQAQPQPSLNAQPKTVVTTQRTIVNNSTNTYINTPKAVVNSTKPADKPLINNSVNNNAVNNKSLNNTQNLRPLNTNATVNSFKSSTSNIAPNITNNNTVSLIEDESTLDLPNTQGVFDGFKITTPTGKTFEVSQNYSAKTKILYGDVLRLTKQENGVNYFKHIVKQNKQKIHGMLTKKTDGWYLISDSGAYRVSDIAAEYKEASDGCEAYGLIPENVTNVPFAVLDEIICDETPVQATLNNKLIIESSNTLPAQQQQTTMAIYNQQVPDIAPNIEPALKPLNNIALENDNNKIINTVPKVNLPQKITSLQITDDDLR